MELSFPPDGLPAGYGRASSRSVRRGVKKTSASEVDDCPTAGFPHVREYCSRGQKRAQEVVVQFVVPIVQAVFDCGLVAGEASRQIDQNIDPSVFI